MKVPFPSEKSMEDYVCERLDSEGYCPITDQHYTRHFRQMNIPGYGITDLILVDADPTCITLTVIELKNTGLCSGNLEQLGRYMTALRRFAEERVDEIVEVRGVLAGPFNPKVGGLVWLYQQTEDIEIYAASIDVENGFEAEPIEKEWYSTAEDFDRLDELSEACQESILGERAVIEAMDRFRDEGVGECQE